MRPASLAAEVLEAAVDDVPEEELVGPLDPALRNAGLLLPSPPACWEGEEESAEEDAESLLDDVFEDEEAEDVEDEELTVEDEIGFAFVEEDVLEEEAEEDELWPNGPSRSSPVPSVDFKMWSSSVMATSFS